MKMAKEKKEKIIKAYKAHERDTGSSAVQIALLTDRINGLADHFKAHKKDHHSRHGLLRMVNQRRKLLAYLKEENEKQYEELIQKLNLRK
ncbi:MAG: 30S ribosomal protein S15 [Candidatus Omnitrophota bacterium]